MPIHNKDKSTVEVSKTRGKKKEHEQNPNTIFDKKTLEEPSRKRDQNILLIANDAFTDQVSFHII